MKIIKTIKHLLKISIVPLIALLLGLAPATHADPILKVCFDGTSMDVAAQYSWQPPAGWYRITLNCALGEIYPPNGTGPVPACHAMSELFNCLGTDNSSSYPVTLTEIINICAQPINGICPRAWFAGGQWSGLGQNGLYGYISQQTPENSFQITIGGLNTGQLYQICLQEGGPGYFDVFDMTIGVSNLLAVTTGGAGGQTYFQTTAYGNQIILQVLQDANSNYHDTIMGFTITPVVVLPSAPTGLTAVNGFEQVALSWNPSTSATYYNVKRRTWSSWLFGHLFPWQKWMTIASPTGTHYTNNNLAGGAKYYYVVSAVNAAGEQSANSSVVVGTAIRRIP